MKIDNSKTVPQPKSHNTTIPDSDDDSSVEVLVTSKREREAEVECQLAMDCQLTTIKTKQPKMNSYVAKTITSKVQKTELDLKAAKFWYASNLAFSAANLKTWKDFCTSLRPGYDLPSEDMLSGSLLDKTYTELRNQMEHDLKGKEGTLIQDGWSNIHNAPILSHSVICNGEAYLINSIECKGKKKTAEYCASKFEETILQLQSQGFKVIAGSTDNCNTMIAMRRILKSKYPSLLLYGCTPHMLNKLCEVVSSKETLAKINEVEIIKS